MAKANRIINALWGDLKGEELKKFSLLALGFFFLIGSYWPLKTLKDSIFINIVGQENLPYAKMISLALFFPLVLAYSKLIDHFSKEAMIYGLILFYGILGLAFVAALYHPTIGLQNTQVSSGRLLGWLFFVYVESYISLMVSLYWSFVNDITTPESAKKGYGLIIFGTQLGGFLFILLGHHLSANPENYAQSAPLIVLICVSFFFAIALIIFLLQHVVHAEHLISYEDKHSIQAEKETTVGFLDGLKVLVTRPYVAGIFGIIFFHEFTSTIMGYQMFCIAKATYPNAGLFNKFMFDYALAVQGIACLFGLVGTSFFQRRFGIKFCIVAYPVLLGLFILSFIISPTLNSIFCVMLIAKAINFALNQPAKEVLYIPTSKNIKFKSKAWVDMFGMRFAKGIGSMVNKIPSVTLPFVIVLSIIGLWTGLSNALGNYYQKAVADKKLIE
ncbi:MAG: Npt1/Npt2 family nucleotide transporter [bacterium]